MNSHHPQKNEFDVALKINITNEVLIKARERASKLAKHNKYKITPGCEIHGMIGEELFLDNFGGKLIDCKNYDIDHKNIGKIDIKTKRCNSAPKDHYICDVAAYQVEKNDCDFYAFYRVKNSFDIGWFLGIISKKEFVEKATFIKKGTVVDGLTIKADCYHLPISKLKTISEAMNETKSSKCGTKCKDKKI